MRKKCKDIHEAARLSLILKRLGAPAHMNGLTVSTPDSKIWNKALKQLHGQNVIRKYAESKSMMETKELI